MTGAQFKAIRVGAELTQSEIAALFQISDQRAIRRWEQGERAVSGPATVLAELLAMGKVPPRLIKAARIAAKTLDQSPDKA